MAKQAELAPHTSSASFDVLSNGPVCANRYTLRVSSSQPACQPIDRRAGRESGVGDGGVIYRRTTIPIPESSTQSIADPDSLTHSTPLAMRSGSM